MGFERDQARPVTLHSSVCDDKQQYAQMKGFNSTVRLSDSALASLRTTIARPTYDRRQQAGIVHFGIGAFHRAHQAMYTDVCLDSGDTGWMIDGVSLRSETVANQLNPQDGLYTLTQRSASGPITKVNGAVREVLVADVQRATIVERIANPACSIVSFTVTEKGYCRGPDGALDRELAKLSFYPLLGEAMARREAAGLPGLTLLSCDNLSSNGSTLRRLMSDWLESSPPLLSWFDRECTTPNSMVDRIVPATTPVDLAWIRDQIGLDDEGAVFAEPFTQWVIEDSFAGPRPAWDHFGVQLVDDVAPFELAKLRMLNGAHSLLAYCGLQRGHSFVHEAVQDAELRRLAERLMIDEAASTIPLAGGLDLRAYAASLLERFANPAMNHRLSQIAMDGSQKLSQRWLGTLSTRRAKGLGSPAIEAGIECWLQHLRKGEDVNDPRAEELMAAASAPTRESAIEAILGPAGLVPMPPPDLQG